jgi:hypothetical protein
MGHNEPIASKEENEASEIKETKKAKKNITTYKY